MSLAAQTASARASPLRMSNLRGGGSRGRLLVGGTLAVGRRAATRFYQPNPNEEMSSQTEAC